MTKLCFCGARNVEVEHATYVIGGVPACNRWCYEELLEAAGARLHHTVMVTYRREGGYVGR
jgi:hypothetical protein